MHELSICMGMLKQVCDLARQHQAQYVQSISLQLGPLSGVEAELMQQVFPIASAGTLAEGAQLLIQTMPVRVRCNQCDAESDVKLNKLSCPNCGNWQTQLISGDEMILSSIQFASQH